MKFVPINSPKDDEKHSGHPQSISAEIDLNEEHDEGKLEDKKNCLIF